MIKPALQDNLFLADVAQAARQSNKLHLWWLGQSGFLIEWQDNYLLIDPYLSDSLTKKYAGAQKPHVRMTERVIAPERLNFISVVTSSHNHTDHLDGETIGPLMQVNPALTVLIPAANRDFAADRLQVKPDRLTAISCNVPLTVEPFTFTAIPAAHEQLETDAHGRHKFIGLIIQAGPWTIYHSGDTVLYDGLVDRLRGRQVDLALLPINGRDPARGVAGNLSGPEAVELARHIGAGLVIPCHFEMFEFNTVSPEPFQQAAQAQQQPYRILKAGERLSL